jgi:hypothetical protein
MKGVGSVGDRRPGHRGGVDCRLHNHSRSLLAHSVVDRLVDQHPRLGRDVSRMMFLSMSSVLFLSVRVMPSRAISSLPLGS